MKNFFAFVTLIFLIGSKGYSQTSSIWGNDFVKFTGNIKLVDSSYLLDVKLAVTGKEVLNINKVRFYDQGNCGKPVFGRLFLEKQVRNVYVNISTNAFRHELFDKDWDKLIKVDEAHPIRDTIPLDNIYPFEIGNYRIMVEIDYYYKNTIYKATTEFIEFSVPYLPKKSIYN